MSKILDKAYLFSTQGTGSFLYLYLIFFAGLILASLIVRFLLKRKEDYEAKRSFEKQFFWTYFIFGIFGLASVFARYENLPLFGNRITTFFILGLFMILNIYLLSYFFKVTKKEALKLRQKKRKEKWLKKK